MDLFKDISGEFALHSAVAANNTEVVELLLENNADPYLQDSQLRTPLYLAIEEDLGKLVSDAKICLPWVASPFCSLVRHCPALQLPFSSFLDASLPIRHQWLPRVLHREPSG